MRGREEKPQKLSSINFKNKKNNMFHGERVDFTFFVNKFSFNIFYNAFLDKKGKNNWPRLGRYE